MNDKEQTYYQFSINIKSDTKTFESDVWLTEEQFYKLIAHISDERNRDLVA